MIDTVIKKFMDQKLKATVATGECPNCNSRAVEYSEADIQDETIHHPAQCLVCGCEFEEVYVLEWIETSITE